MENEYGSLDFFLIHSKTGAGIICNVFVEVLGYWCVSGDGDICICRDLIQFGVIGTCVLLSRRVAFRCYVFVFFIFVIKVKLVYQNDY